MQSHSKPSSLGPRFVLFSRQRLPSNIPKEAIENKYMFISHIFPTHTHTGLSLSLLSRFLWLDPLSLCN